LQVTDTLAIKTELFNRRTTRERMRKIALDLCDKLEVAQGAAVMAATKTKPKD
jgi:hypothetical protein